MIAKARPKATKYEKKVDAYVKAVVKGTRVVGELERFAVERYIRDRAQYKSKSSRSKSKYYFDPVAANRVCRFFETFLKHSADEYHNTPFEPADFQCFVLFNLFGFKYRRNTGAAKTKDLRRFRRALYEIGRGNGKTPFGAGVGVYCMRFDRRPDTGEVEQESKCYSIAVKTDQARIAFDQACRYVELDETLSSQIRVQRDVISHKESASFMKPLPSEAKSLDGLRPQFALIDELHAWTEQYRETFAKLRSALSKRGQSLSIITTTAGTDESQLWLEQYNYARSVVTPDNGIENDELFVFICEIDDGDDPLDEGVWPKANPLLSAGVVKIDPLRSYAAEARANPSTLADLIRYHCNKMTRSANKAFTEEMWKKGIQPRPDKLPNTPHSAVDLGWTADIAAVGYCFPLDYVEIDRLHKRRYWIECDAFMPAGSDHDLTQEPFASLIKAGLITVTQSETTDTAVMYETIAERVKRHGVRTMAFDPNNCREFATTVLNTFGIESFPFTQSHSKYNEPLREFKAAMLEGRILHAGCPLLHWTFLNVIEEQNAQGHFMPSKSRSHKNKTQKIDPAVAVLMAFSEVMFADREKKSVYAKRGVRRV